MNIIVISFSSLKYNKLSAFLNILLIAFGVGILTILMLANNQIQNKLENNARGIDAVVGAKGSPLQLILSSIYYIDFPTGNIPLADAEAIAKNRMVKLAVPLALGDNFNGFRIVGTNASFIRMYNLKLDKGKFWKQDFEVTLGAEVAKTQKLKVGDLFFGAHGLADNSEVHEDHAYKVAGILTPNANVTDQLVLTNLSSVWHMHQHEEAPNPQLESPLQKSPQPESPQPEAQTPEAEITSLLIKYKSPMSVILFPKMVNETTNLQAASPAIESTRLFSLIGVGVETLQIFAYLIMAISVISVFISLYNSLKQRKYDLAIMRTMGASKTKIFLIVILEGFILSLIGTLSGSLFGHIALQFISSMQDAGQVKLTGLVFLPIEFYLILVGLCTGIFAAFMPAIAAYRINISKILAAG